MTTTLLYNPGVVTEYDGDAAHAALTCPFCGKTEPNVMLLENNHWVKSGERQRKEGYDWARQHGMCLAQRLITNHIAYYCKGIKKRDPAITCTRKFDEAKAQQLLAERIERGKDHGIDAAKIMAFYTDEVCAPCTNGEHGRCLEDTMWSTLLGDVTTCTCTEGHDG